MNLVILAAAGLAMLVLGCSSDGSFSSPPTDSTATSDAASPEPTTDLDPIVRPLIADAAERLSVEPTQVTIVSVEAVTWSDGSLGCPRPGELYTQALVDGHRVVITAAGSTLDYRVTGPGSFRVCENPPSPEP